MSGKVKVCKKPYGGWPNCYWLSDGRVELVVTADVGPRVIRFGFVDDRNIFREYSEMLGRTDDSDWLIYGGHRLWQAPEDPLRTYFPDNGPLTTSVEREGLRLTQPVEGTTGIQKSLELRFGGSGQVVVTHRLSNRSGSPVELAPWAITVLAEGGTAILPLPPRGTHPECLSPNSILTLWPYTDLSDSRWTWGQRYILLRQVPSASLPQKLGASVADGWIAYANDGRLFVKAFERQIGADYPDLGANVELFTNGSMLEMETLGPLKRLAPGEALEHHERWFLFRDVPTPRNDHEVDQFVVPRVSGILFASAKG